MGPGYEDEKSSFLTQSFFLAFFALHFCQARWLRKRNGASGPSTRSGSEAIRRAEVGQYPLIGLDPGDVKEAFESIHTSDKDEWAAGFMHVADRYFNEAKVAGEI